MNLHEYQSKQLFARYNVPVPEGRPAVSVAEARAAAQALGGGAWVVKAQVHAGGRGKAGGVVLVDSAERLEAEARRLLGGRLVTRQSGAEGLPIHNLLVEVPTPPARELYLSMLVDRGRRRLLFMASAAGGMDIEEVAAENPEAIVRQAVDPHLGILPFQARAVAAGLGLDAYISGEISESTVHAARELGIHYFAAGHHATERYGVQALGEHLAKEWAIEHTFIDIDNPV